MITVGYGDIIPVTIGEKLMTIFTMLMASAVFAYSMNRINELIQSFDNKNSRSDEYIKNI